MLEIAKDAKKKLPGTIKTYLASLLHFYDFVRENKLEKHLHVESGEIENMKSKVLRLIRAWRKKMGKVKLMKQLKDLASMSTLCASSQRTIR